MVFREGELSTNGSPPAPTSSPQSFTGAGESGQSQVVTKTEPPETSQDHPHAAESRAAQAAFEAQMKQFYNNPFASQLLAASSKMFTNIDLNPFLQRTVKMEPAPDDEHFADADSDRNQSRDGDRSQEHDRNCPVDLVTHSNKSIDAIASKLVNTVAESENRGTDDVRNNKEKLYNCSDEIRKEFSMIFSIII